MDQQLSKHIVKYDLIRFLTRFNKITQITFMKPYLIQDKHKQML